MVEDLLEVRSRHGHGSRSGLAETDAVPVADSSQQHGVTVFLLREVIAPYGTPPQAVIDRQANRFVTWSQRCGIFERDPRRPLRRMHSALLTFDCVIRIRCHSESHLGGSSCPSAATAGVHSDEGPSLIRQDQIAGLSNSPGGSAFRRRRGAEILAVGGVAEIEFPVTSASRYEIGSRRDGMGFQCFHWRVGSAFRRDD